MPDMPGMRQQANPPAGPISRMTTTTRKEQNK